MIEIRIKDVNEIRYKIAKNGYSLRSFAKEVDMSHSYLSQILNGIYNPSPTTANKIAKGLNTDVEEFFLIKVVGELTNKTR